MIIQIYRTELHSNKANSTDTEALFLDLHLSILNAFYPKFITRDEFVFDVVNFPSLDDDVSRAPSHDVYVTNLIRFGRLSSHLADFSARKRTFTAKFLNRDISSIKFRKHFLSYIVDTSNWFLNIIPD